MKRRTAQRKAAWPVALTAVLALGVTHLSRAAEVYDAPLRVQHVRLPADPSNPDTRREVVCWSYPNYMVKQVDFGEVGAERLAILPAAAGKMRACREPKEADEYAIPVEVWSGYFAGTKGGFAFFNGEDGVNGGDAFMVLRIADKKKLLEDVVDQGFESMEVRAGAVQVRYRRVYSAACSVETAGASCIDAVAKATGVSKASLAICSNGYRAAKETLAAERCKSRSKKDQQCVARELDLIGKQKWDAVPSVITYEVELELREGSAEPAQSSAAKPLGDALRCYPAD